MDVGKHHVAHVLGVLLGQLLDTEIHTKMMMDDIWVYVGYLGAIRLAPRDACYWRALRAAPRDRDRHGHDGGLYPGGYDARTWRA